MKKVIILLCLILACTFTACGYTKADIEVARSEGYDAGYDDGFAAGYAKPRPVAKPSTGTILAGREYYGSEITVHADSTHDYVVSLKDYRGTEYVAFYVKAGTTVTIGVPDKYLYVYFASGKTWYGYGKGLMFGDNTSYSKDDDVLDFTQYTWEYTLYPVDNGNFSETPSSEKEFFD